MLSLNWNRVRIGISNPNVVNHGQYRIRNFFSTTWTLEKLCFERVKYCFHSWLVTNFVFKSDKGTFRFHRKPVIEHMGFTWIFTRQSSLNMHFIVFRFQYTVFPVNSITSVKPFEKSRLNRSGGFSHTSCVTQPIVQFRYEPQVGVSNFKRIFH